MSDFIAHECGLALVRLRRPISWYRERYGDPAWGLRRLYLLMEKQHNRGQDGAGLATIKFDMPPGDRYLLRVRSHRNNAIERIFDAALGPFAGLSPAESRRIDDGTLKRRFDFLGELHVGHLRYGTHSGKGSINCHPLIRKHIVASRNLAIAGNFNLTNSGELFAQLVEYGLDPVGASDTQIVLERLGYFVDQEHDQLRAAMGAGSLWNLSGRGLADEVSQELDPARVLAKAAEAWDGGYVFAGALGNGDAFACRDPAGIRPGYFHVDDEVVAVASERAALANVFDVDPERVEPIAPGHVLVVKRDGSIRHVPFTEPTEERRCTFERIYFSRGNDPAIYRERKALGRTLAPRVLEAIDHDIDRTVFSFIPNTAESAYFGLVEQIGNLARARRVEEALAKLKAGTIEDADLLRLSGAHVRAEKIAHKDQRMRTFITHDAARRDLVLHVYDITRGVVGRDDTLVVLDDSIVRGTTLRESIITILSRLEPRRILVVSSAPPILYPDCYGIDMSQLGRFIGFEAAVALLRERGDEEVLDEIEALCLAQAELPAERMVNHVARLYDRFTLEELEGKIAELVRPPDLPWRGEVQVLYQSVEGLQAAMPEHTGDWYFTGRYPTPGGFKVLNQSFLNWRRNVDSRAYEAVGI